MKRIIRCILVFLTALSLVSCNNTSPSKDDSLNNGTNETTSKASEDIKNADKSNDKQTSESGESHDYRDFLDWNGYYTGGWMDTGLLVKILPEYDSGQKCGVVTEDFRGSEFDGMVYYTDDSEFTFQINNGTVDTNYLVYPKLDGEKYLLDIYSIDGEYDCTFSREMTYDEYCEAFGIDNSDENKKESSETAKRADDLMDGTYTSSGQNGRTDKIIISHANGEPQAKWIDSGLGEESTYNMKFEEAYTNFNNINIYKFLDEKQRYSLEIYQDGDNIVKTNEEGDFVYLSEGSSAEGHKSTNTSGSYTDNALANEVLAFMDYSDDKPFRGFTFGDTYNDVKAKENMYLKYDYNDGGPESKLEYGFSNDVTIDIPGYVVYSFQPVVGEGNDPLRVIKSAYYPDGDYSTEDYVEAYRVLREFFSSRYTKALEAPYKEELDEFYSVFQIDDERHCMVLFEDLDENSMYLNTRRFIISFYQGDVYYSNLFLTFN